MGCAASMGSDSGACTIVAVNSNGNVTLRESATLKDEAQIGEDLEKFVFESISTGKQLDAVRVFFQNQSAQESFLEFLRGEHSQENGLFIKELDRVMRSKSEDLGTVTSNLVNKYIKPGSSLEINISEASKSEIIQKLQGSMTLGSNSATLDDKKRELEHVFKTVQTEVLLMIATDAFPRYLKSEIFQQWRKAEVDNGFSAVNVIVEIQKRASCKDFFTSLNDVKLDPTRNTSTSFIQRAFAALDPEELPKISQSAFLCAFLGAAEGLPVAVSLASATRQNFPLIYVNALFENITGYSRQEIIGKNCRFLQNEKTEKESINIMADALGNSKPVQVLVTNYRKNGEPFLNLLAMKPLYNTKGTYSFVIGLQYDVSGDTATGSIAKLQLSNHLMAMLPDRLPKNDEYMA